MPLYEYKCQSCGDVFEVIQKFADLPVASHAKCGGSVERLVSAPSLQFKGTGWYVTDYGRKSGSNGGAEAKADGATKKASSESPASGTTTTTTASTSESKSEKKTEKTSNQK